MIRCVVATEIFAFEAATERSDYARRMRSNDAIRPVKLSSGGGELRGHFFLLGFVKRTDALGRVRSQTGFLRLWLRNP